MTGNSINKDLINTQNQLLKTLLSMLDLEEVFTKLILEEQKFIANETLTTFITYYPSFTYTTNFKSWKQWALFREMQ